MDVAARNPCAHAAHIKPCAQFGFFNRVLDGLNRLFDIDHHAAAHTARGMMADANDIERVVGQHLSNHSNHFGGTNIQSND